MNICSRSAHHSDQNGNSRLSISRRMDKGLWHIQQSIAYSKRERITDTPSMGKSQKHCTEEEELDTRECIIVFYLYEDLEKTNQRYEKEEISGCLGLGARLEDWLGQEKFWDTFRVMVDSWACKSAKTHQTVWNVSGILTMIILKWKIKRRGNYGIFKQ